MYRTTTCKKRAKKILRCSKLKTYSINYNSGHAGAGIREQARRVTDWGGRRWEMAEPKGRQQQETQARLQRHACPTWMDRIHIFQRPQLEGSFVGDLLSKGINPVKGAHSRDLI